MQRTETEKDRVAQNLTRRFSIEPLEARRLLACAPEADIETYCLSTGGVDGDGRVSLHYDPSSGALSVDADGLRLIDIDIVSESGQFTFPNGAPWNTGQSDIASGGLLRKLSPPVFGDIDDMAFMSQTLSEYDVLADLRISGSAQTPGDDGQFDTNDDQLIDLSATDLIYEIIADIEEPDSPESALELTEASPFVQGRTLHEAGDEDWYSWTATERGRLSIEVFFEHVTGDAELELYDSEQRLLVTSSTTTRNESVHREVLPGETYLIRVFGFKNALQSNYDLVVYLVPEEAPIYVVIEGASGDEIKKYSPDSLQDLGTAIDLSPIFGTPTDVELGPNGLLYVSFDAGSSNDRIVEWTPAGVQLREFHLPDDIGSEAYPRGFDVLEDGTFLIAQPNQERIIHLGRTETILNEFAAGDRVFDSTVVIGPQPDASASRQLPIITGDRVHAVSPTPFGSYWTASDEFLHLFESSGELLSQVVATAPSDVQEAADRTVFSIDDRRFLRRRHPPQTEGIDIDFERYNSLAFHLPPQIETASIATEGGNRFARLTELQTNTRNTISFDRHASQTGSAKDGLYFSFDFRMTDDATNNEKGGCCGRAAHGLGVGLFDTAVYGTSGYQDLGLSFPDVFWERPIFPRALTLGFDVAQNDRLTINWDGATLLSESLLGRFELNDNEFHRLIMQLAPAAEGSIADLWLDDELILSGEHLLNLDLSQLPDYRIMAGGRTGLAMTRVDIDNLSLRPLGFLEDFQGSSSQVFAFRNSTGTPASLAQEDGNVFARLTSLTPNNHNALAFDETRRQSGAAPEGLVMSFDFRMSDDDANRMAGGCCSSAADGLGIGLFVTSEYGEQGAINPTEIDDTKVWESPFFENALTVGLRIFENVDVVTVSVGGNQILTNDVTGDIDLSDNHFHRTNLMISVTDTGQSLLSLWIDDKEVFSETVLTGFHPTDIPRYRVIAGGRTGSAYTNGDIDNIAISSIGRSTVAKANLIAQTTIPGALALAVSDGEFPVPVPGGLPDRDGDGLYDSWETQGIDINGDGIIELQPSVFGADPDRKDLFVEIDAIQGFSPSADALQRVIDAFADVPPSLIYNPNGEPGIKLHLTMDDTVPATLENLRMPGSFSGTWERFHEIRDDFFGTSAQRSSPNSENILAAKDLVYRYAIFGSERGVHGRAGLAELPGRNLLVTLGGWRTPGGTPEQQAAVFMHELGHTLGLAHGGDDDINYKANYLSVMNYSHADGGTLVNGQPFLDYSRYAPNAPDASFRNQSLDELQLNESTGIGFPNDVNFSFETLERTASSNGPTDWDQNGVVGGDSVADVNLRREGELHKSYNDWGNLIYNYRFYHHSGEGGIEISPGPDDRGTHSDQCSRFLGSDSDRHECNETPETGAELPEDEDLTIDEPNDNDWFWIDLDDLLGDLGILGIVTVLVDAIQEDEPAPPVQLEAVGIGGTVIPTSANRRGSTTEYSFIAERRLGQPNGEGGFRFFVHIQSADESVSSARYRLRSSVREGSGIARWTGAVDDHWNEPRNWQGGSLPHPGDEVIIDADAVRRDIDLQGSRAVSRLTVEGAAPVRIFSDDPANLAVAFSDLTLPDVGSLTVDPEVNVTTDISQYGGHVTLLGQGLGWHVMRNGSLEGHGQLRSLRVDEGAEFSAGSFADDFLVAESIDIQGTLIVDILPRRDRSPQLEQVIANRVTLGARSNVEFRVVDAPATARSLPGVFVELIIVAATVTGRFGSPAVGERLHVGRGIFFREFDFSSADRVAVELLQATPGDVNGDREFNSSDLIAVFQTGLYEDDVPLPLDWTQGDWNFDGRFGTADLIAAFQTGNYERGPV